MEWIDIACIVFVCVTANHLGLISAIEEFAEQKLPIINCIKCSSFWTVFIYLIWQTDRHGLLAILAISFLASYIAIWLELLEGCVDTLYLKVYESIYGNKNDTAASVTDNGNSYNTVP